MDWPANGEPYAFLEPPTPNATTSPDHVPSKKIPVLLVHGFTGSPNDLRPVAETLYNAGHPVEAIQLPGHCHGPAPLNASTREEWSGAVRDAAERLKSRFGRLAVCGLSMGGLLTLQLAQRHPDTVDALVSLASPIHFPPKFHLGIGAYRLLGRPSFMRVIKKPPRKEGLDETYFGWDGSGDAYPMEASLELEALRDEVRASLAAITHPILVVHGKLDPTTPWSSAIELISEVSSETNRLVLLQHSLHVLPLDLERDRVLREVSEFLSRL